MRVQANPEQAEWIRRAQADDADAFERLVEMYQTPVYNLCYRMLGEPAEAEDAAQETFVKAFRGLHRYDPGRPFGTWLLSIASHHCIDQLRRRRLLAWIPGPDRSEEDEPDLSAGPEEVLTQLQMREQVEALLQELPILDRSVVVLRYWSDLSTEAIGETLSLSVPAVKTRLHRARRTLARRWLERERQVVAPRGQQNEPSPV